MRFILPGRRRSATLPAVIAGVAAAGAVAAGAVAAGAVAAPAQAQPDPLYRFEHQAIAWHDCRTNPNDPIAAQLAAVGALCGEMRVPLDYRHPDGRAISIAVDQRPATTPRTNWARWSSTPAGRTRPGVRSPPRRPRRRRWAPGTT